MNTLNLSLFKQQHQPARVLPGFHITLGFTLVFNGKGIEHGIELYEKGGLDRKSVKEYGLEESEKDLWRGRTKVAGKKLLYIHKEALRKVFGDTSIHSYQNLWKVGGVVERAARRADSIARSSALAVGGAAAGSLKRRRSTRCTGQPESIPNASAKVPPLSASYEPCSRPVGSPGIKGNQRPLEVIRGHQRRSPLIWLRPSR
jgi:hypothetical protein